MPKMPKPNKELEARVDRLLRTRPPLDKRPMFGCAAWFNPANDQMAGGIYGDGVMLRVGQDAAQKWVRLDRAAPFDPAGGRPMREYVYLDAGRISTGRQLATWLDRALAFTAELPGKPARKRSKTKRAAQAAR